MSINLDRRPILRKKAIDVPLAEAELVRDYPAIRASSTGLAFLLAFACALFLFQRSSRF